MVLFLFSTFSACSDQVNINEENKLIQKKVVVVEDQINLNDEFLKILNSSVDGKEYLNSHSNTKVIKYELQNFNDFESLKNQTQYKEMYQNLPKKNLYYVEFSNGDSLNIISMIDLKKRKVLKIFGVMIVGMKN